MEEPQRPTLSRELDRGTLDAHRLLVMWLFICSIVIGLSFVALVLYFDVGRRRAYHWSRGNSCRGWWRLREQLAPAV